jgi:hypothetical protein
MRRRDVPVSQHIPAQIDAVHGPCRRGADGAEPHAWVACQRARDVAILGWEIVMNEQNVHALDACAR